MADGVTQTSRPTAAAAAARRSERREQEHEGSEGSPCGRFSSTESVALRLDLPKGHDSFPGGAVGRASASTSARRARTLAPNIRTAPPTPIQGPMRTCARPYAFRTS